MAAGLNGSYGSRTEANPNRGVGRTALAQGLASKLHYQSKRSAQDVFDMPEQEWASINKGGSVSRQDVANYLRAYEHYQ
jgi:hypothetical protein